MTSLKEFIMAQEDSIHGADLHCMSDTGTSISSVTTESCICRFKTPKHGIQKFTSLFSTRVWKKKQSQAVLDPDFLAIEEDDSRKSFTDEDFDSSFQSIGMTTGYSEDTDTAYKSSLGTTCKNNDTSCFSCHRSRFHQEERLKIQVNGKRIKPKSKNKVNRGYPCYFMKRSCTWDNASTYATDEESSIQSKKMSESVDTEDSSKSSEDIAASVVSSSCVSSVIYNIVEEEAGNSERIPTNADASFQYQKWSEKRLVDGTNVPPEFYCTKIEAVGVTLCHILQKNIADYKSSIKA